VEGVRHEVGITAEGLRHEIRVVGEGVMANTARIERLTTHVERIAEEHDARLTRLEASSSRR
jgi:hypothetical protein